jgi:hypothetical protein
MTHHLVAYVLRVSGGRASDGANNRSAVVVARHASPAFYLASLRRSRFAASPGCALPEINSEAESEEKPQHTSNRPLEELVDPCAQAQEDKAPCNDEEYRRSQGSRYHEGGGAEDDKRSTQAVGAESKHVRDLCAREFGAREKFQDLFILWKFLVCVSLSDLEFRANRRHLRSYLERVASVFRAPSSEQLENLTGSFLSDVFEHPVAPPARTQLLRRDGGHESMDQPASVVRVTVYLFLRAAASSTIKRLVHTACTASMGSTSPGTLQADFMSVLANVYVALDDLLVELSPELDLSSLLRAEGRSSGSHEFSLPALVDEILSLVYGRTHFSTLRPEISAVLMSRQGKDLLAPALEEVFKAFTAQVRESIIVSCDKISR